MALRIGILGYGSLINDPGHEIAGANEGRPVSKNVKTPFRVEFARSSRTRMGAPTLVPVDQGGAHVDAVIYEVTVDEAAAADMLYRREIHRTGQAQITYREPASHEPDRLRVKRLENFAGYDVVLYTGLDANITNPHAEQLAALAINSAPSPKNGIAYLMAALESGIETPLSHAYKNAILRKTGSGSLKDALKAARRAASRKPPGNKPKTAC